VEVTDFAIGLDSLRPDPRQSRIEHLCFAPTTWSDNRMRIGHCILGHAFVLVTGIAMCWTVRAEQVPPLALKVITAPETSLSTNMTLVMGKTDAALIDVPFTRADGYRLVADILDTGKTLKYVFITHDHPDHFMSLEVLAEAFPNARLIAAPIVVADIWRSVPIKLKRWGPMLGVNGPRRPVVPTALTGSSFQIEGQVLQVLGPMQGDHVHSTAVYIPSLNALIAGDLVFENIYPWLGEHTPERRQEWLKSLDRFIAMKPAIVVAGHQLPGDPQDPAALQFTRDYNKVFGEEAAKSKTSAELAARMRAAFPKAKDVLGDFILGNSSKVGVGEMAPWDE
jgi:glyoxylase-like metal-dependent hydrolase (beta-lactamase superfamily II)